MMTELKVFFFKYFTVQLTTSFLLGQKCVYILPGNTEKETYRVGTFLKFPEYAQEVVDVCVLARYGFYYIGYKDRVKCFR